MKKVMKYEVANELKAVGLYGDYSLNVYKTQLKHLGYGLKFKVNGLKEATEAIIGLLRYEDDAYLHQLGRKAIVDVYNKRPFIMKDKFGNLVTITKKLRHFELDGTIYGEHVRYVGYSITQVLSEYMTKLALDS